MNKLERRFGIAAVMMVWLLSACTMSRSVVSKGVDLGKYEYVSVINNATYCIPAELMEYEIQLFDAVEASGLQMVSDWRIPGLAFRQQERLLLAKYGVKQTEEETVVIVNFVDYLTGRPVVSCRGVALNLGISYSRDIENAIENAVKQIKEVFRR